MPQARSPKRLANLIFVAMALGVGLGVALWTVEDKTSDVYDGTLWTLDLLGPTLFVGALKMIVAPLILASIVAGVTSLPNLKELGNIGLKAIAYYLSTTCIAVAIGLGLVHLLEPGRTDASIEIRTERERVLSERRATYAAQTGKPAIEAGRATPEYRAFLARREGADASREKLEKLVQAEGRSPRDMLKDDLLRPLLMNPFQSLAASPPNSLGIICFSILFGVACLVVGKPARPVVRVFKALNQVILQITHWLMAISPFAIFCLTAAMVARNGPEVFASLGGYCGTVLAGILLHVVVLVAIAAYVAKVRPLALFRGIREAWLIAFTTRSSVATLPVTLSCVTEKLRVSPKVANFTLPLGATVNMDGTALYEGVAVIFLLQLYGGLDDVSVLAGGMVTLLIFVTAVLASVGAAAVPDAGLITMVLVASAVHLPVYYIPLIFAVDAFLDMFRTSTNVLGDAVGSLVIQRLEASRLEAPSDQSS